MTALPSDITIIGTVLALAIAILLLSGLALYVAFRVRETLHDEKGGGARAAKVAFLIGLLFLSGGVFYFFASSLGAPGGAPTSQTSSSTTLSSSAFSSATSTPTASLTSTSTTATTSTASTSTSTSTTSTTTTAPQSVSMTAPSCQGSRVKAGSTFTCDLFVYNQGSVAFSSATVDSSGDFAKFIFLACTESANGGTNSQVPTTSNTIAVGNIVPGTTALTLTVQAPSQSGQYNSNTLILNAPGFSQPISVTFSIQVTA